MGYARTEAIKEGQTVSLCISKDQATCSGTNWSQGWLVYSNPAGGAFAAGTSVLLKTQAGFTTTDTVTTTPVTTELDFNRNGFAVGLSTTGGLLFENQTTPATVGLATTRCLWIGPIGTRYIQTTTSAVATGQGTNKCT